MAFAVECPPVAGVRFSTHVGLKAEGVSRSNATFCRATTPELTGPDKGIVFPLVANNRFPKRARLNRKFQFDKVFTRSHVRVQVGSLRLITTPNGMNTPRLGIITPKRVIKRAIDRNRAKRYIREAFRRARRQLPPLDIVVQVISKGDVQETVDELWLRLCD